MGKVRPVVDRKQRRKTWRLLLILLLIFLSPPLIWVIANQFDELPSAAALAMAEPLPHEVADADNAWLLLNGIGAAEDEDPVQLGRRRVEAFNARVGRHSVAAPDAAEQALFADALPLQWPPSSIEGAAELCPYRIVDCLDWVDSNAARLAQMRKDNPVRLRRADTFFTLPQWDNLYSPHADMPYRVQTDLQLYYDLLAADALQAVGRGDQDALAQVLGKMAGVVRFFRRVQSRPQEASAIRHSAFAIARMRRLLDQLLDRLDAAQIGALQPSIAEILQAPATRPDWSSALRREYQAQLRNLGEVAIGDPSHPQHCVEGGAVKCSGKYRFYPGYLPQATRNLIAANYQDYLRVFNASAANYRRVEADYKTGAAHRSASSSVARKLAYNPLGKVMAAAVGPDYDWGAQLHDLEALRRSYVLKRDAAVRGLSAAEIPAFLASQPAELRNPWTGEPLEWEPRQREIGFVPVSDYWRKPRLGANYRPPSATVVTACAAPLRLVLRETYGAQQRAAHTLLSCGQGNIAFVRDAAAESADLLRYERVRAVRDSDHIDIQAWLSDDDGKWGLYEIRGAVLESKQKLWLDRIDTKSDGTRIDVETATAADAPVIVSIAAAATPARTLLQQIAAAAQLRIDGLELAGDTAVTLNSDIPAADAIQRVALAAGLESRQQDEGHFVLARTAPPKPPQAGPQRQAARK